MNQDYKGQIKSRVVDVRFPISGKIASVNKFAGDRVKKQDLIASLDRKILQTELDRQLADFEKARADFESFAQKFPDPQDPIDKYSKSEKQAILNASVKEVELAKAKLDQCDLFSPVDGIIIDDSSIVPGLNITPASSSIKIEDSSSFYLEIEIEGKDVRNFRNERPAKVKIEGEENEIDAKSLPVISDGKHFFVKIPISGDFLAGMNGQATFQD